MKKAINKPAISLFLAGILLFGLAGCGLRAQKLATSADLLTQKPIAEDKIPVTVLVKYAFSVNTFEQAAEERFPQLDLIQVGNYTDNSSNELEQRMANDDLTDLIFTWPMSVGQQYFE